LVVVVSRVTSRPSYFLKIVDPPRCPKHHVRLCSPGLVGERKG
jgi:hypothetical protein